MPLDFNGEDPLLPAGGQGGVSSGARILATLDEESEVSTPSKRGAFLENPIRANSKYHMNLSVGLPRRALTQLLKKQ